LILDYFASNYCPLQNIGNSYRLVISSIVEKDFGDYSCRASNQLEEDVSQKIVVTGNQNFEVIGKKKIVIAEQQKMVVTGLQEDSSHIL